MTDCNQTTVVPWPAAGGPMRARPSRLKRPCDWCLDGAVGNLETQLGTVEAYNRLVEAAERLRARIEAGDARPQNLLYAVDPRGARG